jgi:xylulokinase
MTVLGLDVGTTGVKAVVVDDSGSILGSAIRDYQLITPQAGWIELDPVRIWQGARDAIREATATAGRVPDALGLSCAGEAFVPVDRRDRALGNAIVSFDRRAVDWFARLMDDGGADQFEATTGLLPLPHYAVSKLAWWTANRPDWFASGGKFVTLGGFLARRLGGESLIDPTLAMRTLLYDPRSSGWAPELLARAGIRLAELPAIAPSRAVCGEVSASVGRALGLRPGGSITVGGLDQACAAFGAGVSGDVGLLSIGTTAVVARQVGDRKRIPPAIPSVPTVQGRGWLAMAGSPAGGAALNWFHRTWLGSQRRQGAALQTSLDAIQARRTDALFLPHLAGSRVAFDNPAARGAFLGLTFDTERADLVRGVLDGVAYESAVLLERLAHQGLAPARLRAAGGGSLSRPWLQIISDAIERPVDSLESRFVASFGAARLASARGAANRDEITIPPMPIRTRIRPRREWRTYSRSRIERFKAAYAALVSDTAGGTP